MKRANRLSLIYQTAINETGYSLVEVMVSIMILTLAIIPMVGMFDAGLRAASTSGNYDKARTLASMKLEEAKTLGYDAARTGFPEATCTLDDLDADGEDTCTSLPAPAGFSSDFTYTVEKQYLQPPSRSPSSQIEPFAESNSSLDTRLMRMTVTVVWNGNTYETKGVLAG